MLAGERGGDGGVTYIQDWDSGQPGAYWDQGLQWDVNVGPSPGDVQPYLGLVTSQHADKPKFVATLSALVQPLADLQVLLAGMPGLYDVDAAVGAQEDAVGQWVGVARNISVPLTGVYFSWDVDGLGWGQGNWTTGAGATELIVLPDDQYRTLLYATIAANQWDGTIPGAYAIWDKIFSDTGTGILIQDGDDMHMTVALTGPVPDAVTLALFTGGYLDVRPAGVMIDYYWTPAAPDAPYFGWDAESAGISGWGIGYWGVRNAAA